MALAKAAWATQPKQRQLGGGFSGSGGDIGGN